MCPETTVQHIGMRCHGPFAIYESPLRAYRIASKSSPAAAYSKSQALLHAGAAQGTAACQRSMLICFERALGISRPDHLPLAAVKVGAHLFSFLLAVVLIPIFCRTDDSPTHRQGARAADRGHTSDTRNFARVREILGFMNDWPHHFSHKAVLFVRVQVGNTPHDAFCSSTWLSSPPCASQWRAF